MKLVLRGNIQPPQVDSHFHRMSGLQRAAECWRYVILRWEHWASPTGDMREWLRRNSYVGAWLLIPAIVRHAHRHRPHPVAGDGLAVHAHASIAGKLIVLPILILVAFTVIRIVVALLKR